MVWYIISDLKNKLSLIKARIDVEKFKYTKPSLSFLEKYNLSIKYRNKIIVAIRMTSEKKIGLILCSI